MKLYRMFGSKRQDIRENCITFDNVVVVYAYCVTKLNN